MGRNTIFPPNTEMAEIRLSLPKSKLDELKALALNVGNAPQDYLRALLFSHLRREAEKGYKFDEYQ